ncbi:Trm112 family protein [Aminobacter sp. HY435]|uniref:Trm112 family protein n=1 Tax=Aminobacter sp. HY435 TaxID=2970917 RepID=UPI0022B9BB9F|nr:Trm112 family protein [Aminobacter sp. HY435]
MVHNPSSRDIDIKLLELLACPLTKGPLVWDAERSELVSRLARLAYPVRDGIPVMLPSEARQIADQDGGPSGSPPAPAA